MRALPALLFVACAAPLKIGDYATTKLSTQSKFSGPRFVALAGNADDAETLATMLERRGFRVAREVPGGEARTPARYVVKIGGVCGGGFISPTMEVDAFDVATHERVLRAEIAVVDGCPNFFLRDVAIAIDRAWPVEVPDLEDATLRRKVE